MGLSEGTGRNRQRGSRRPVLDPAAVGIDRARLCGLRPMSAV
jgi:hypothetical protein